MIASCAVATALLCLGCLSADAADDKPKVEAKPARISEKDENRLRTALNNPANREKALKEVKKYGPEADALMEDVCEVATDRSAKIRQAAVEAMEAISPQFYNAYDNILMDQQWLSRTGAMRDLPGLKINCRPGLPILLWRARTPADRAEFDAAMIAMVKIAADDKRVIQLVMTTAKAKDSDDRRLALSLLGDLPREPKRTKDAVGLLVGNLVDKKNWVTAVDGLVSFGADSKPALPELRKLAGAGFEADRNYVKSAIQKIEDAIAHIDAQNRD